MSNFLTIMRVSLIPALEKMVSEEEKHLNYLRGITKIDVTSFIRQSEENLEHLNLRLSQYKKYLKENTDEQKGSAKANREG